ncbi:MAG: PIN domain-containing protein [Anaerolineae bacterium]|nr:PIN domain-containing protein [Anaerolineae bacterium]
MTPLSVLIDSSFLFAINSPTDRNRARALQVAQLRIRQFIVPDIVLAETAHMLRQRIGQAAVLTFLDVLVNSAMELMPITKADVQRARQIMATYASADFDLADCCIMALAERLQVTHVCTFDERDFRQFRPQHTDYLTLLPADLPVE